MKSKWNEDCAVCELFRCGGQRPFRCCMFNERVGRRQNGHATCNYVYRTTGQPLESYFMIKIKGETGNRQNEGIYLSVRRHFITLRSTEKKNPIRRKGAWGRKEGTMDHCLSSNHQKLPIRSHLDPYFSSYITYSSKVWQSSRKSFIQQLKALANWFLQHTTYSQLGQQVLSYPCHTSYNGVCFLFPSRVPIGNHVIQLQTTVSQDLWNTGDLFLFPSGELHWPFHTRCLVCNLSFHIQGDWG